jgi:transposase-like protein
MANNVYATASEKLLSRPEQAEGRRVQPSPMQVGPAIRKDDLGRFACPNQKCRLHGLRNRGNVRVNGWSGRGKRNRQLICRGCGKTFSENYNTPFYGLMTDKETVVRALRMVVERGSMRGAARAMEVDKDTVCDWVRKASDHSETLTEYMLHDLQMPVVEVDELWATVKRNRSARLRIG